MSCGFVIELKKSFIISKITHLISDKSCVLSCASGGKYIIVVEMVHLIFLLAVFSFSFFFNFSEENKKKMVGVKMNKMKLGRRAKQKSAGKEENSLAGTGCRENTKIGGGDG